MIKAGSQLVSTIATTGIPNLAASVTAITSSVISTTNNTSGTFRISIIPPKNFFNLSSSFDSFRVSRFVCAMILPLENASSRCTNLSILCCIVLKLVIMPPNHLRFIYIAPDFSAYDLMIS